VTKCVILQKLYGPRRKACAETLIRYLKSQASGLEVTVSLVGQTERGWAIAEITGSDERVAINYLRQRIGIAPATLDELESSPQVKGAAIDVGRIGYGLFVDVGLSHGPCMDAFIPLHTLRRQVADGARVSTRMILQTYCIYENFPLSLRLIKVDRTLGRIEAEFSDPQISIFESWFSDGLDRVLAFGVSEKDLEEALVATGLRRHVVKVEQLGLFEQSLQCRPGTEAPGVIARLGNSLRGVPLRAFSPHKARILSGSQKVAAS